MDDMSGMDDMSSTSSNTTMTMKSYLHASIPSTDTLLFASWMPSSVGAVIGASIGLFFLAVLERFLSVVKRGAEGYWRRDALRRTRRSSDLPGQLAISSNPFSPSDTPSSEKGFSSATSPFSQSSPITQVNSNPTSSGSSTQQNSYLPLAAQRALGARGPQGRVERWNVPFVWKNDLARGALESLNVLIRYLLMLTAMTFNIWYISAIVIGAGVGEALFGRHGGVH